MMKDYLTLDQYKIEVGQRWMYSDAQEKVIMEITNIDSAQRYIYGKCVQLFYSNENLYVGKQFITSLDEDNLPKWSYLEGQDAPRK